jgi:hypothetical protein
MTWTRVRNIDHGRRFGWSQTSQQCPIYEAVHPDNFVTHFWALLHQAGYVSFAHHDSDGVATYTRIESGAKMWILFRLKSQKASRTAYANAMMKLVDYTNNMDEVRTLWDAEVVYLGPGDCLYAWPTLNMLTLCANARAGFNPLDRCTGFILPSKALRPVLLSSTLLPCIIQRGRGIWTARKPLF